MKKILLLFAAMICAVAGWATDEVTATYTSDKLEVALTNETSFVAFQMDIVLDADVDVTNIAKAGRLATGANVTIGSETVTTEFIVASNQLSVADGKQTVRVIAYNMNNHAISDAEGTILTATLSDKPEYVTIENIKFVKAANLEEVAVNLGEVKEGAAGLLGDVNLDEEVDIFDLMYLLKYINEELDLDDPDVSFSFENANVYEPEEDEIDIFDFTAILAIINAEED